MRAHAAPSARSARLFRAFGAVLFVASLAYFGVSYLTSFGVTGASGDGPAAISFDVTLFTLFALHHSVFARLRVRQWIARAVAPELERSVYVWIASLLFIAVCALWRPIPGVAWDAGPPMVWALWALQAAGLWLTLRSAVILDIRELAGIPRPVQDLPGTDGVEFRTTGPYGWVRHPIYAGWFLFVWSASPMTMTRLVFAAVSCAYLLVAIPLEERTMRAAAGDAYERYMAQVRWRLVPGVY